jgi:hypothetical protein
VRHRHIHAQIDERDRESEGEIAPGQSITHYAPSVPTCLVRGILEGSDVLITTATPVLVLSQAEMGHCVVVDFAGQLEALRPLVLAYRDLSNRWAYAAASY